MKVRHAGFALRVESGGVPGKMPQFSIAARSTGTTRNDWTKVAPIAPLAFTAGTPLLRSAVRAMEGNGAKLSTGAFHPLDTDWGARVACYALVASRLRRAEGLSRAASHLGDADAAEAAWWLGLDVWARRGRTLFAR